MRNAVELVPPTAFMIIQQKTRFVNSSFYTIFCPNFRQKRYTIENLSIWGHNFCGIFTKNNQLRIENGQLRKIFAGAKIDLLKTGG